MKIEQNLSSGIQIRQDFSDSVRIVMFDTGNEEWRYATDGGTAFLLNVNNEIFGLTAKHAKGTFEWEQLAITAKKLGLIGDKVATIEAVYFPSDPRENALDTDIVDVLIIKFKEGISFFEDGPYIVDKNTVGQCKNGDVLFVEGSLKEHSDLSGDKIETAFAILEFQDAGQYGSDVTLRKALAKFDNPKITSVAGLSGSPVFSKTQKKLVGMVMRGGIKDGECTIYYVDIIDVMALIDAVSNGKKETSYKKMISNRQLQEK